MIGEGTAEYQRADDVIDKCDRTSSARNAKDLLANTIRLGLYGSIAVVAAGLIVAMASVSARTEPTPFMSVFFAVAAPVLTICWMHGPGMPLSMVRVLQVLGMMLGVATGWDAFWEFVAYAAIAKGAVVPSFIATGLFFMFLGECLVAFFTFKASGSI